MTFILPRSRTSVGSRADPDSEARGAPTPAARAGRLARSEVARARAHAALTKAPRPDRAPSELQAPRRQVAGGRCPRLPRSEATTSRRLETCLRTSLVCVTVLPLLADSTL